MGRKGIELFDDRNNECLSIFNMGSLWSIQEGPFHPGGGLFASVNQMGVGFPNSGDNTGIKSFYTNLWVKYLSTMGVQREDGGLKKKGRLKLKIKIKNPSLRRLISGGVAGAILRNVVAPLETIRTHLMVGSSGHTTTEVFNNIIKIDGWQGLFRGNFVNVIRVDPVRAIEGVLDGKCDDLPEQSFYMVGGIEEVIAKANKIAKESAA